MPRTRECDYCGDDIEPGTGTMFVYTDGSTVHFCSSKCEKNLELDREARDVEWTAAGQAAGGTTRTRSDAAESAAEAAEPAAEAADSAGEANIDERGEPGVEASGGPDGGDSDSPKADQATDEEGDAADQEATVEDDRA